MDDGDWTIDAVAIFDNYLPTPPAPVDVPFISHRAFLSGIGNFARLRDLAAWIRSGAWLPRSEHFTIEPVETTVGEVRFVADGLIPTEDGYRFVLRRDAQVLKAWQIR